jgi:hypothetical protein
MMTSMELINLTSFGVLQFLLLLLQPLLLLRVLQLQPLLLLLPEHLQQLPRRLVLLPVEARRRMFLSGASRP